MSRRLLIPLCAILVIGLVMAGCGSSDDSTETSVELTKAQFIKRGDAICKKGNAQIEREVDVFVKKNEIDRISPTEGDQNQVTAVVVVPALQAQADELSELGAPTAQEEEIDAIIDALESGIDELEDDPGALFRSEVSPLDEAKGLAEEFGFKVCGKG